MIGDETVIVQAHDVPIKILGLHFVFNGDQSYQAREVIGRIRAAFSQHRELLKGQAEWKQKVLAIRTLLEGTFTWVAGALYWGRDDLAMMNTLQLHVLRDAFHLRRKTGED